MGVKEYRKENYRSMSYWTETAAKINELRALLTLAGRKESTPATIDRLVEEELERVRREVGLSVAEPKQSM
jgi:hypothetical protein